MSKTLLGFSLGLCGLCLAQPAFAEAKRCVAQNNDGAQQRDEHHLLAAREAYRACVAEPECPEMVRAECDSALTDLKTAIPTLLVAVVDEQGHDIAGSTLTLDGKPVALDGSTIEVDPGSHQLEAKGGELSSELNVVAIESDLNRRVEITLHAPKAAEPLSAPPPAPEPTRRSNVPAYVLGGVAAAGLASFGYFAGTGYAEKTGTLDHCKPYCAPDDVKSVRTQYLVADVSLGVSLVALAAAGYWLISAPKAPERASQSRFFVGMTALPHEAGVSLRWIE
ncbi:MAG TPA: hypothetical protein VHV51_04455 [Polyangiaceae bacterium]|jgi:hypothetical protein|nr:hypothetical protein [Polyangiaceae bacterium]